VQEHRDGRRTTIVGAPNEPPCIWRIELVDDRADVVEICGGTPLTTAARVLEAAGDSATVGLVSWPFESIDGVAAYKAAYEASTA
jgi:hypothetical protein